MHLTTCELVVRVYFMSETIRVWCFGKGGKLIVSALVRDMEQARLLARDWNRGNKVSVIEIVANGPIPAQATKVSAV